MRHSEEFRKYLTTSEEILILQGTNNIRAGDQATEIITKIQETITQIQQTTKGQITILQIPPMAKPMNIERRIENNIYNTNLPTSLDRNVKIIKTQETKPKSSTIHTNGYHLIPEGAQMYSDIIHR